MPASWGVAVGMLGAEHFAEDAVLCNLDDDAVLCAKHYRHVSRAIGRALLLPADAEASDAPT